MLRQLCTISALIASTLATSPWDTLVARPFDSNIQQPLFSSPQASLLPHNEMSTETKGFPNLKLNNGETIPLIAYGLGTANYKRGDKNKLDQHIVNLTVQAIQTGFTHLDGAEAYGNEAELGAAIRAAGVPREALYVVTKATPRADRSLEENFAASLEKLGLDYVDLYLIHSPFQISDPPELAQKKWAEMEAIHASGRAKSIGVSNFLQEHLEPILATAQIVPAINQIEFHPYLQHVTPDGKWDLLKFCKEKGIALSGYAGLTALTAAAPGPVDGKYEELASKYNVTEGNVALRWTLDQGIVAITTSSREDRLRDYLEKLPSFNLSEDEVKDISELGRKKHYRAFWTKYFEKDDRR